MDEWMEQVFKFRTCRPEKTTHARRTHIVTAIWCANCAARFAWNPRTLHQRV